MMNETKSLIKCSRLALGYGNKNIVNGFDYEINAGDYLCIIGRNGCGKTTFLRGLAGVLRPKSGKIELCDNLQRKQIGYLPQITIAQKDFPASVEEIVLSAFQGKSLLLPFYGRALRERASECLALTRTENLRKMCFRELSGGQKQRVLLARALCAAERLLLLDEPVTGLDPESSKNMYNIIKELHEQKKMTVVMVTHDVDAATKYATRVLDFNNLAFPANANVMPDCPPGLVAQAQHPSTQPCQNASILSRHSPRMFFRDGIALHIKADSRLTRVTKQDHD